MRVHPRAAVAQGVEARLASPAGGKAGGAEQQRRRQLQQTVGVARLALCRSLAASQMAAA